ncbi:hypothetical protein JW756_05900 [Candidatus Woesearchaeota archaeon]|nr:hypothetical protein [Candidatus Woesearchaeota archaeon]
MNEEEEEKFSEELKRNAREVTEQNKTLDEAYDDRLRRLEAKKKFRAEEKEEAEHHEKVSRLREKLAEIKVKISEARRRGKDPFIADMMLRNVPAKIKMAEASQDKADFDRVERIIKEAEEELEEALIEEQVNVKKEIQESLQKAIAKETGKPIDEET